MIWIWVRISPFAVMCLTETHPKVNLRNAHAWSVPTEKALKLIASYAPLLELGAGTGYWASQLMEYATDLLVFDEKHFQSSFNDQTQISEGQEISARYFCQVQQGGPEIANKYADRTLLLMWPDYMGYGAYGLQCLQHYQGNTLILIGEWKNSTFGSYAQGISEHGQSFSLDFQEKSKPSLSWLKSWTYQPGHCSWIAYKSFEGGTHKKKRRFRKGCIFLKGLGPTETVVILHKWYSDDVLKIDLIYLNTFDVFQEMWKALKNWKLCWYFPWESTLRRRLSLDAWYQNWWVGLPQQWWQRAWGVLWFGLIVGFFPAAKLEPYQFSSTCKNTN